MVGKLVRNGDALVGPGDDPAWSGSESWLGQILQVRLAYEQAGRELATTGRIRRATQKRANQEIVPVPLFHVFKRIRWAPFKRKFIERANSMRSNLTAK